ncbi:formin-like protein 14 [Dorcoceras hygrometricum]|uniref:Formin-like protein 14 n=1 Tax=Dorcoceras hygrometricum TaxID=472368 RepID=A0A2Z7AAF5_9LAMI|nr:formin-like protein 14 [Dorcoceras hygrometricum]
MLCMRTRLQPKHREPKNLKELLNNRYESTEQQWPRGSSNTDLTPAKTNTNTISGTVTQKPRIESYELNQICPTLLTLQKALNEAQGRIFNTYPTSYLNSRRNPMLMLTDYTREMSSKFQLETDARIEGSMRKSHVLVIVTHEKSAVRRRRFDIKRKPVEGKLVPA